MTTQTRPSDRGTGPGAADSHLVVVFSHSRAFRDQIRLAVGRRPAPDLGRVEYIECTTGEQVVAQADAGGVDLMIFDGEAQPTGGMGICRQLKSELDDCPKILVVVARRDDRWLATWSQADGIISQPLDAAQAAAAAADLLRVAAITR
jgi:DNA-binding NarL/FixJ family response regulator